VDIDIDNEGQPLPALQDPLHVLLPTKPNTARNGPN